MNIKSSLGSQEKQLSIKLAVQSPEVLASLNKTISSLAGLSLLHDNDVNRVDILVLEIGSDPESEFETIRLLLKENVVGSLFLTSAKTTPDILLPALRAGAKEFFPQPIDTEEVRAAFLNILSQSIQQSQKDREPPRLGKIISVLGAKGGVGTTTFAVNLAASMQMQDKTNLIALVDLNRLTGEIPLFLDLETDTNWEEIGKNLSRLDKAYLQSAMAKHSSGMYVLPAPSRKDTETHLKPGLLLSLLKNMRQFFDYIVVDNGSYLDDSSFKILHEAETVYIISILSLPCVINARKLQESIHFSAGGADNGKIRIIANRFERKSQISLAEANKIIGTEIATTIPNNYSLTMSAINSGRTIVDIAKKSEVTKTYKNIAASFVDRPIEKPGGLFGWIR